MSWVSDSAKVLYKIWKKTFGVFSEAKRRDAILRTINNLPDNRKRVLRGHVESAINDHASPLFKQFTTPPGICFFALQFDFLFDHDDVILVKDEGDGGRWYRFAPWLLNDLKDHPEYWQE